ncbi:MAG: hypothetical protein ACJ8GN_07385 [Longimicrobiaceae bacterium]
MSEHRADSQSTRAPQSTEAPHRQRMPFVAPAIEELGSLTTRTLVSSSF